MNCVRRYTVKCSRRIACNRSRYMCRFVSCTMICVVEILKLWPSLSSSLNHMNYSIHTHNRIPSRLRSVCIYNFFSLSASTVGCLLHNISSFAVVNSSKRWEKCKFFASSIRNFMSNACSTIWSHEGNVFELLWTTTHEQFAGKNSKWSLFFVCVRVCVYKFCDSKHLAESILFVVNVFSCLLLLVLTACRYHISLFVRNTRSVELHNLVYSCIELLIQNKNQIIVSTTRCVLNAFYSTFFLTNEFAPLLVFRLIETKNADIESWISRNCAQLLHASLVDITRAQFINGEFSSFIHFYGEILNFTTKFHQTNPVP